YAMKGFTKRTFIADRCLLSPALGAAVLLLLVSFGAPVVAVGQTIWTDGTGDWFVGTNWSAGVPSSSTQAKINNGGTAQISVAGATADSLLLGYDTTKDSGTVTVSGSGNLAVNGAAQVSDDSGEIGYTISSQPNIMGVATVTGPGSA